MRGEEVLIAAGRAPTAGSLALENAGIELEGKGLVVDEHLRTTVPNVYAAGDITGKYLFTHVAEYQGRNALRNALFPVKAKADHRVGLTEEQARREHDHVEVFRQPFGGVDRAMADGELRDWINGFGALAPIVFIAIYAVATVAFLPGTPLSLLAGLVFGTVWVVIGASIGATLAFLVGRYAARGLV